MFRGKVAITPSLVMLLLSPSLLLLSGSVGCPCTSPSGLLGNRCAAIFVEGAGVSSKAGLTPPQTSEMKCAGNYFLSYKLRSLLWLDSEDINQLRIIWFGFPLFIDSVANLVGST